MKNITVIGAGYVGLVTGTCFSDLGNRICCLDIDEQRIANLRRGISPIYEPGLNEVMKRNIEAGRLWFTTSYEEALEQADFAFIAVGTPSGVDGEADLRYVRQAATAIAKSMRHPLIIVNKSTVPVGTGDWVASIVEEYQPTPIPFSVVSCPEFLREGSAITDFMNPHRTVLGSTSSEAADKVAQLHLPLRAPIIVTDLRTAEMIKYASNAFLATKISFINEIANICEALGADVKEVANGMGFDARIGRGFLDAGLGYGGSCFPKDVKALTHMATLKGRHPQLLEAVMDINADARLNIIRKLREELGSLQGKRIGLLGLAFKPNTDDMRDAPATDITRMLVEAGVDVVGYDPVSMIAAQRYITNITYATDPYQVAKDCDALVLVTEWNEFKNLDFKEMLATMRGKVFIDGRNLYNPKEMTDIGFQYRGMGRGYDAES